MAVPLNKIITDETKNYFRDNVDPASPPPPSTIETELLDKVNDSIEIENVGRPKRNQLPFLKTLTADQIAWVLLNLHQVCKIAPAGKNTDPDYDLVGIYMDEGPDKGVYITSEESIRRLARKYHASITTNEFREVLAAVRDRSPRRRRCIDPDLIPVNNGVFNYRTKELEPHSPDRVFVSKSSVNLNFQANKVVIIQPDGTPWDVETWIDSLSDDPAIRALLWQILGAIIRPFVRWNKSVWFYSESGNNGKGTLCELMRNLCGPASYASIPLSDFGKDFLLEPLTRASAIIVDENDVGTFIDKAANLKAVVTNDVISINRKFKTPIAYQFFGFMVQCLNEFPRIKDKSESFNRRQLFVPFEKNFKGIENRAIKGDYLSRPEVLEYVLWKVLLDIPDYYELDEPSACLAVLDDFKLTNDTVRGFWSEFEDQFVWDLLPIGFLYDLYKTWFWQANPSGCPVGKNTFRKDLEVIIGSGWMSTGRTQVRPAQRMNVPEPLIVKYDLKAWMNPFAKGSNDVNKLAVPVLDPKYTGLVRLAPGKPASVPDDDDDDEDLDEAEDVSAG